MVVRIRWGESLLDVDPGRGVVRIVESAGPVTEKRPADEDPAAYTAAVRMLADGAEFSEVVGYTLDLDELQQLQQEGGKR